MIVFFDLLLFKDIIFYFRVISIVYSNIVNVFILFSKYLLERGVNKSLNIQELKTALISGRWVVTVLQNESNKVSGFSVYIFSLKVHQGKVIFVILSFKNLNFIVS